ncbi:MAG: phosphate/phosphite/phosphonate ABC transporter substrate-binding protein [Planctomycetota bacterium]|jgi:ABC-type phosphate/phosphonate transport system substrate-binding protein
MRAPWLILSAAAVAGVLGIAAWLGSLAPRAPVVPGWSAPGIEPTPLRLGLLSEGDVFAQRRRYQALAEYLEARIARPVELVTEGTLDVIVDDFSAGRVDAAIVGPLGAVLLEESCGARSLARSVPADGERGLQTVIFVRDDARHTELADLAGRTIAMLRSTACGELFPRAELARHGLLDGPQGVLPCWADSPEHVVRMVVNGEAEAGATTQAWLTAAALRHAVQFRTLAVGEPLPGPALVVRDDLTVGTGQVLAEALLDMPTTDDGRAALSEFGASRFVRCERDEFDEVRRLLARLDNGWRQLGLTAPEARSTQVVSEGDG